jgi:hypothetical protein
MTLSINYTSAYTTMSIIIFCHYAECRILFIVKPNVHYARYRYVKCHYAECHGAFEISIIKNSSETRAAIKWQTLATILA